ncbi:MAG: hypothetical protein U5K37_08490 [Natrialbaceae archaeon]|nr:hypothetical protein [Natrialbaceae archaeon]
MGADTLSLTVAEQSLERTGTTDVRAILEFVDGTQLDVTDEATIRSTNASIATVSGRQVVGNATGNTTLAVTYNEWTATTAVTVIEPTKVDSERDSQPADGSPGFEMVGSLGAIVLARSVSASRRTGRRDSQKS